MNDLGKLAIEERTAWAIVSVTVLQKKKKKIYHRLKMAYCATLADVEAAQGRIKNKAHVTPLLTSMTFDTLAGCRLFFKCEALQKGGITERSFQLKKHIKITKVLFPV